jgi:hypothetical protein
MMTQGQESKSRKLICMYSSKQLIHPKSTLTKMDKEFLQLQMSYSFLSISNNKQQYLQTPTYKM